MQPRYIVPPCRETVGIVYEDPWLLVVEKPPFLLTIPGRGPQNSDCLISRVRRTHLRASVAHRLDLDTSGLLVLPLMKPVNAHLSRQLRERLMAKEYIAIVDGHPARDEGIIDLPIAPDWQNRPRVRICPQRGKPARTRYRVLERLTGPDRTRLHLKALTGRTHQLRIHLRELGHPILGCDLYGSPRVTRAADRLLLHASRLVFEHPLHGSRLDVHSTPPF